MQKSLLVAICHIVVMSGSAKCLFPLGSIASKIFHEVLLDTCIDLPLCCWPQDSGKKRKKDGQKNFQTEGKRSKPQRKDAAEVNILRLLNPS